MYGERPPLGVLVKLTAKGVLPDVELTASITLSVGLTVMASALAGALWYYVGPTATFVAGAALAAVSMIITGLAIRRTS